jgi:G3E family GTPase
MTPAIPLVLLTGFLGSGKTTLLNRLLAQPDMADTLVIINEYGAASLDHLLVAHSAEQQVIELASGCVCCTLRSDLAQTLRDAPWRFARGGRRQFERVIIETTGLADPAPVLRTLMQDGRLAARYAHATTLTTVDATHARGQLDAHPEVLRQITGADRLLVSKSDLATPADVAGLRDTLARLNPFAPHTDLRDDVRATELFAPAAPGVVRYRPVAPSTADAGHGVRADRFVLDAPVSAARLSGWLSAWPSIAGPALLRMKALIDVVDMPPAVLHGVQHTLYPEQRLAAWPGDGDGTNRRSTLVFITQGMAVETLRAHVARLGAIHSD